jgi:3-oxoacyl-[acyl-carrier protein] reductase
MSIPNSTTDAAPAIRHRGALTRVPGFVQMIAAGFTLPRIPERAQQAAAVAPTAALLQKEDVMKLLSGKVALVTGSSRGIGAAISRLLADQGAKVALHGRDTSSLSAIRNEIEGNGGVATQVVADVSKFAEIETMRQQVEENLGPIAILVANAGGSFTMPGPIEEISEEGWHASVDGNLTATFLTIKSVLPGMKQRRTGNIITISSSAGRRPHPQAPIPYSAAKAGIQILTQDVAAQAGPFGIRANCIAPEVILTERNRERIPESQQKSLAEVHPIRRLGVPEDVAQAALFLASDESAWVTGVILDVAGGAVMV